MSCVQLLLAVSVNSLAITSSNQTGLLPSATNVISLADSHDRATFTMVSKMKEEPMDVDTLDTNKEEVRLQTNVFVPV